MEFQMEMTAVKIQNSVPQKAIPMATWNASLTENLVVKDEETMAKHSAVTVYRIVTLVVSNVKKH
jgi:hypothetical protein